MSRDFAAFLLAFVYTIGFLVFSITTWVDFTDTFVGAERCIAYGSMAILNGASGFVGGFFIEQERG